MKYVSVSDIHLAHRRTPTPHIIHNFKKYILNEKNKDIDCIFIGGDLYDRLIDVASKDNLEIISFLGYMLDYCYNNDITLCVLEGTPGHDWTQPKVLVRLNQLRDNPIDLRYFDTLTIDYMEKFNKYVLYIPDEWSHNHDDIERQIKAELDRLGITQVDIAILHSVFGYQVAGFPYQGFSYKEDYFLSLVKEFIHIGHYHIHSNFDRIIAGGSFDRLSHNEEGEKGFVIVNGDNWRFVENKDAYTYKTIRVTKKDTLNSLDEKISKYKKGSYIRLNMAKDHPFNLNFKDLTVRYMDYHLSKKVSEDTENNTVTDILNGDGYDLEGFDFITMDIKSVVKDNLLSKFVMSESEIKKLDEYLDVFTGSESKEENENG